MAVDHRAHNHFRTPPLEVVELDRLLTGEYHATYCDTRRSTPADRHILGGMRDRSGGRLTADCPDSFSIATRVLAHRLRSNCHTNEDTHRNAHPDAVVHKNSDAERYFHGHIDVHSHADRDIHRATAGLADPRSHAARQRVELAGAHHTCRRWQRQALRRGTGRAHSDCQEWRVAGHSLPGYHEPRQLLR